MDQLQITYRGMAHSPAMDARIAALAAKLDGLNPRITRCHVVVAESDKHKQKGNLFEVHLDIHTPRNEIVATRHAAEDAYVAITQAFDAAIRQLEDANHKHREEAKHRREPPGDIANS